MFNKTDPSYFNGEWTFEKEMDVTGFVALTGEMSQSVRDCGSSPQ